MDMIPDLISLLKEQNQEVRYEASRLLSPFATEPAGRQKLIELDAITVLIRLLGDIQPVVHHAIVMLINLSEEPEAVKIMLKKGLVSVLVDGAVEEKNTYLALYAALLSNLTIQKEGCEQMEKIGFRAGKLLQCLITAYVRDPEKNHPVGLALVNMFQIECIKTAALDPSLRPALQQLLTLQVPLTTEKVFIRRTLYKIIRNLCFGERSHKTLLTEVNILPVLLAPLRGTETLTDDEKVGMNPSLHEPRPREPNTACQVLLLEALHLFTGTRLGRVTMRDGKAYPILREFDKTVDDSESEKKEAIFRVIEPLISDEGDVVDEYDDAPAAASTNTEAPVHVDKKTKMEEDGIEEI